MAQVKRFENDVNRAKVGANRIQDKGLAGDRNGMSHPPVFLDDFFHFLHQGHGPFQGCGVGQLGIEKQISLILVGIKPRALL